MNSAVANIVDVAAGRQTQRLRISLILANVFIEVCAQELRWAQSSHKDERTRKNRRRVEAAQAQMAEAAARKRDAQAALVAHLEQQAGSLH